MPPGAELQPLTVAGATAWSAWLAKHATSSPGVWLTLAKKGVTNPTSLTYAQALDEALCHGWIDGQAKSIDEKTFSHRFTPRTAKSIWSKRNVGIISRLESEDRMCAGGIAAVAAAKADGRWDAAYEGSKNADVPVDFLEALEGSAEAKRMYEILTKANKYAIYWRLQNLKTEKGRKKRIQEFVEMLARGETVHPQKARPGDAVVDTAENAMKGKGKGKAKRAIIDDDDEMEEDAAPVVQKRARKKKEADVEIKDAVKVEVKVEAEPRREGLRTRKPKA
ncbi:hypothetical protein H072_8919 [Dactylellina haptotyla CBS 200.50]|uniref:Bacteriocin-protection protein, YdeI/OmpD-associated family n=1 Tax=Dactylellina haptotyla (strain CBS 200.50) TaxID=1284197 RepID=S8A8L6_DACHA|nr:hypothetical protein H072_8919 [Dactylellina haptotyla CBS 200.50]